MKILVIQDTFVSGTPVFAGEVLDQNQTTRVSEGTVTLGNSDLANLRLANRVVSLKDATDEQLDLVDARQEINQKKAEAAEAAAKAKAEKIAKRKKTHSAQTNPEGGK